MHNIEKFNDLIENSLFFTKCFKIIKKVGIKYAYFWVLHQKFKDACGYELNLDKPKTFSEKIQWIKVNCHDKLITKCADKYRVRNYVADKIGKKYLTEIYGVWKLAEEIDFNKLPNSFVLKTNHASGQVIIIQDKCGVDEIVIKRKLKNWVKENYYYVGGEWAYKDISPVIMCEKLLQQKITDYKFYCFNGVPRFLYISQGLEGDHHFAKMSFVDLNWNLTEFQRINYLHFDVLPAKPQNFDEMIMIAKKLSSPFYFVRVDLYSINSEIKFSELTFYPNGGFAPFEPYKWEEIIGSWIKLPID